jgi:hypothetical protein
MKVSAWVLLHHNTNLTDAEYNKYIEVFKTLDQSAIDAWLDAEQRRINIDQIDIDHQLFLANQEEQRLTVIANAEQRDRDIRRRREDQAN